jgi:hypothetical protein
MSDYLITICREAGEQLADLKNHPTLPPGALPDQAAKAKLVTDTENLITQAIVVSQNQVRVPAAVVPLIRNDAQMNALSDASIRGQPPNVAAGMAMRFYSGFLFMAKSLRLEENVAGGGTRKIDDATRGRYMDEIHRVAQRDPIFAEGAKFGWWGIKRPDRQPPENVFDNGITQFYKSEYLKEYYQQYPPAPSGRGP